MAPRVVWRVENALGQGPWSAGAKCRNRLHMWDMPTPHYEDGFEIGIQMHEACAIGSEMKAVGWIPPQDLELLAKEGFSVVRIALPAGVVRDGRTQVVFDTRVLRISTIPLGPDFAPTVGYDE